MRDYLYKFPSNALVYQDFLWGVCFVVDFFIVSSFLGRCFDFCFCLFCLCALFVCFVCFVLFVEIFVR